MENLGKMFKRAGRFSILESVLFAILGLVLIGYPEGSLKVISIILGIIFIIIGIQKMSAYLTTRGKYSLYNFDMVYGLIAVAIGIVTMLYSDVIESMFRIIIGVWIVYCSLMRMSLAFKLRDANVNVWISSLVLAIAMFICGVYILANSGAIMVTIGAIIVAYSIIDIAENIIFMKNVKEIF